MKLSLAGQSGPKSALALTLAICTLAPLFFQTWLTSKSNVLMSDFQAFYCAAKVAKMGANPYLNEPLRSCEFSTTPDSYFANRHVTIPAPLPGYTLAFLFPLTALPIAAATTAWLLVLLLAWVVSVVAIVNLTGCKLSSALAIFAFSIGLCAVPFGEVAPVTIAAICAAAFFARNARWCAASICAAISMAEPHLGIPTCVALAIWSRQTRIPLAIAAAVLATLSIFAIGLPANIEYITDVIPAQVLSEVASDAQYSLTTILASLGVNVTTAVQTGSLWYLLMIFLGCASAGAASKRNHDPALLVIFPVAFAVLGGTYVHIAQISAALPAALIVACLSKSGFLRIIAPIAALLLAVPWGWVSPIFLLVPAFPIAWLARDLWGGARPAMFAALVAAMLVAGLAYEIKLADAHPPVLHYVAPSIDPNLAQASWNTYSQWSSATNNAASWLTRIPTWLGLALLANCMLSESRLWEVFRKQSEFKRYG